MVYLAETITATELDRYGSLYRLVDAPGDVVTTTREIATAIAGKSPTVIRAAKESLNGIDLWDVKRSYRFEQGFTFELNLAGVADEHRDAFVEGRTTDTAR
jgi:enoyl-CoA hydratase